MIQEEKVRLMTRCASYEKTKGRKQLPMTGYFKKDYIKLNIWKTLASVTVAYILIVGLYIAAYYDAVLASLNGLQFKELGIKLLAILLLVLIMYSVIARIVYAYRFERVRKQVIIYYRDLKKLKAIFQLEETGKSEIAEHGGEAEPNDEFVDY